MIERRNWKETNQKPVCLELGKKPGCAAVAAVVSADAVEQTAATLETDESAVVDGIRRTKPQVN